MAAARDAGANLRRLASWLSAARPVCNRCCTSARSPVVPASDQASADADSSPRSASGSAGPSPSSRPASSAARASSVAHPTRSFATTPVRVTSAADINRRSRSAANSRARRTRSARRPIRRRSACTGDRPGDPQIVARRCSRSMISWASSASAAVRAVSRSSTERRCSAATSSCRLTISGDGPVSGTRSANPRSVSGRASRNSRFPVRINSARSTSAHRRTATSTAPLLVEATNTVRPANHSLTTTAPTSWLLPVPGGPVTTVSSSCSAATTACS